MTRARPLSLSCPIPISDYPRVLLAHGSGGVLMHQLIEKMMVPTFESAELARLHDGAVIQVAGARLAFTTDSYVVKPIIFPGGDIGTLAVNGTVNDLAMCGARPLCLSVGMILEEGFPMETLWRVVRSMKGAADAAGVRLVTGDTKVVDRGKGDGIFINTAGVGAVADGVEVGPVHVAPDDVLLLNGDVGRHGIAIMAAREGLDFEATVESDCAPLSGLVLALFEAGIDVHCLRDLTRGGLATALVEIAESGGLHIEVHEAAIPVDEQVRGACEILGLDPIYVANEGRFVAIVKPEHADKALAVMRSHPLGRDACLIGRVAGEASGTVTMRSTIGATRAVDMLVGEQLPRIC
jgi:hydrogenase expression/formation protein HypE